MTVCFKCKSASAVVCSRDGPTKSYCSSCFTDFCTRLTRDSLFRNCGLPCDEPVVVAVSGGFSSMMLLHQLGILRTQNRIRQGEGRVTFELIPLHLREEELMAPTQQGPVNAFADEGDDARQENGRYCHTFSEVKEQFEELECLVRTQCEQWEFASTPLFTADEVQIVQYSDYLSPDELRGLREVLHHPRIPLSHRELLYRRLRGRILTVAAVESINKWRDIRQVSGQWYHMLTGENALRCCVATLREVMSNSNSNRIVHFGGHRGFLGQCMVMRPLRSLIPREAVIYCRLHGIQAGFTPSLSTLTALRSFDRTLEVFINIMLGSYRTSIFNVLNTVTRLDVGADAEILNVDLRTEQSGGPCGENTKQAKRVIAGKAAQHHREQLKMRRPICCLWEGADIKGEEEAEENGEEGKLSNQSRRLCLVCGCFIICADEHPVTLRFGRRFVCESCLQLMNDFANTRRAEAGTESERILTDPAVHSAVTTGPGTMLSAFESLTTTMQMLVAVTGNSPSLAGNDGTGEDRCVRRRLSAHGAEEYILQTDDGEKDS
ncbi:hypothetical protein, conserved [Trypanosoma brucei brucei TREU927]|uniref:Cytoplasmic tRNA 2-thiolation protein 2 n=1 Tax=Trypanosoma brucei brucei (strain 927/4 GUTat10.1) TaxID=185431 RepID=Q386A9_TRYB2|nr:hypothetical protein, conserved [Trypanosoma brucei brucei TREU927]EAN79372.1 hypothetical protein, conserved [Trypanosoma brucei brucei TREU927]